MTTTNDPEPEHIVKAYLWGRNNYTLRAEQKLVSEPRPVRCQADIASLLDARDDEATERRGYSGLGAGCRLVAVLDDGTEEEIDDMRHPLVLALPETIRGSLKALRQFIAGQAANQIWDGHNHVTANYYHSKTFLAYIRENQPSPM